MNKVYYQRVLLLENKLLDFLIILKFNLENVLLAFNRNGKILSKIGGFSILKETFKYDARKSQTLATIIQRIKMSKDKKMVKEKLDDIKNKYYTFQNKYKNYINIFYNDYFL